MFKIFYCLFFSDVISLFTQSFKILVQDYESIYIKKERKKRKTSNHEDLLNSRFFSSHNLFSLNPSKALGLHSLTF